MNINARSPLCYINRLGVDVEIQLEQEFPVVEACLYNEIVF